MRGREKAALVSFVTVIERNVIGSASLVIAERAEAASRTDDSALLHYALEWMCATRTR